MGTVKQDVRFQADAFEKIRQIAKIENATLQDTIRQLCDIGIKQKITTDLERPITLTPVEEEILITLKLISAMSNVLTVNAAGLKKTSYASIDELGNAIKKTAAESLQKFKDKMRIAG